MNCAADPRLLPLLASLREPAVRALASLLLGPSPWDSGVEFDRALLAGPRAAERLLALDRRPAVLLDWLAARRTGRLGAHAEALLAFWLAQRSAQLELVAANRVVRVEAHTLGEFDFLLRLDGRPLHVEMACKFYLEVAPQCWVGTDLRDALALKRVQLVRQLALAGDARAAAALPPGFAGCPAFTVLRGQLFRPAGSGEPVHWWRHQGEAWPARAADSRYLHLLRLDWLSPARAGRADVQTAAELQARLAGRREALMVAEMQVVGDDDWQEVSRGFVVPAHWPEPGRLATLMARIAALDGGEKE